MYTLRLLSSSALRQISWKISNNFFLNQPLKPKLKQQQDKRQKMLQSLVTSGVSPAILQEHSTVRCRLQDLIVSCHQLVTSHLPLALVKRIKSAEAERDHRLSVEQYHPLLLTLGLGQRQAVRMEVFKLAMPIR